MQTKILHALKLVLLAAIGLFLSYFITMCGITFFLIINFQTEIIFLPLLSIIYFVIILLMKKVLIKWCKICEKSYFTVTCAVPLLFNIIMYFVSSPQDNSILSSEAGIQLLFSFEIIILSLNFVLMLFYEIFTFLKKKKGN